MEERKKFTNNKPNVCPVCGCAKLNYLKTDFLNDFNHVYISSKDTQRFIYSPWRCTDCGATGREVWFADFYAHDDVCNKYGTGIKIK